jgi:toxin ParE1/3/4
MPKKAAPDRAWIVDIGEYAEADLIEIALWTIDNFGPRQAQKYGTFLETAFPSLTRDPLAPPSRDRASELGAAMRTLHLPRPGRHLLLYQVVGDRVRVVRVLHDSMEITRHLPPEE